MRSDAPDFLRMEDTPSEFLSMSRKAMLQHVGVAVRLMGHLHNADPDLAEMWRSQLNRNGLRLAIPASNPSRTCT